VDTRPTPTANRPKLEVNAAAPRKKRSPWIWAGVGLILLCCLGFGAVLTKNRLAVLRNLRNANRAPTALQQPTSQPQRIQNNPATVPPTISPATEKQLPPEVKAAQDLARSNPKDLGAQFELALVYWVSDMPDQSYETLKQLTDLAGPDNAPFYIGAGAKFSAMQAWPPAAILDFQAVKYYSTRGKVPPELLTAFHEAVYKAADRPEALRVLPVDEMVKVDKPISLV
jgi:hypothetical protein